MSIFMFQSNSFVAGTAGEFSHGVKTLIHQKLRNIRSMWF